MLPSPGQPPSTSLYETLADPLITSLVLPLVASRVLPQRIQLTSIGWPSWMLEIPPPAIAAKLALNVQLNNVGRLVLRFSIPPPFLAEFPLNMQLVKLG